MVCNHEKAASRPPHAFQLREKKKKMAGKISIEVPLRERRDVLSPSGFVELLSEEPDWYSFGTFLGARTHELDIIQMNHQGAGSHNRCLIELYKCLESREKTPSWEVVVEKLKRFKNYKLSNRITSVFKPSEPTKSHSPSLASASPESGVVFSSLVVLPPSLDEESFSNTEIKQMPFTVENEFHSLKKDLLKLIFCMKSCFVKSGVDLSDLQHVIENFCDLDPLSGSEATFDGVFHRLGKQQSIFDSHILHTIVDVFLPRDKTLAKQMDKFKAALENFKAFVKMGELIGLIEKKEINSNKIVRLKVQEHWGRFTISQFEYVMKKLFVDLNKNLSRMHISDGCYCIIWAVVGIDIVDATKLFISRQHSEEFMKIVGVISLQIGEEMLCDLSDLPTGCKVLEAAMLQAVELRNKQAMELLLAVGCSPEVVSESNAVTIIANIRERSPGDSHGVDHVCVLGQNEHVQAIIDHPTANSGKIAAKQSVLIEELRQKSEELHRENVLLKKEKGMIHDTCSYT